MSDTKYKELAKANQDYVDRLRARKVSLVKKQRQLRNEMDQRVEWPTYTPEGLGEEATYLYQDIDELVYEIECEYADVPFAKTRNAGIAGFWREVGGAL